jgi:hypothetical protein
MAAASRMASREEKNIENNQLAKKIMKYDNGNGVSAWR